MTAKHASPLQAFLVDKSFDGEVHTFEPMSRHTTYRIGGPARFFVRADSIGALTGLISIAEENEIPWVIVGKGSNLLVSDEGFDGVVITLGRDFKTHRVDVEEGKIICGAAVLLSHVVQEAFKSSLAGLEFAVGTPGCIGGALRMNAGSRDEWIGAHVANVTTYSPNTGLLKRPGSDITWGYRETSFRPEEIILECELNVSEVDPFFIRSKMEANLAKRKKSQPLSYPSCGSVFRNPAEGSAAKMIDEAGLKGTRIGGAQISELHANFIVNVDNAKAADVCELIKLIKQTVLEKYNVELTPEVKFLGF